MEPAVVTMTPPPVSKRGFYFSKLAEHKTAGGRPWLDLKRSGHAKNRNPNQPKNLVYFRKKNTPIIERSESKRQQPDEKKNEGASREQ